MTAIGRKQTVRFSILQVFERPLSDKADIQPENSEIGLPSGRFTPDTGH
jgi:hypothetical protein